MKLIRLGPIVFRISLLPAIAFIGLLPILVALGFWQLDRAEAKTALLELQEQRMEAETLELTGQNGSAPEDLRYRHAEATGQYDGAHQFLIDNQVLNGRAGYFVLTPLKIRGSATALLVNRGWVPANADRTLLPDVAIAPQTVTVSGRINHFPVVGIKLAGSEIPSDGWPAVVQVAESAALAKRLGYPLFDFQLEMDVALPGGYLREWKTAALMPPEQHRAYAFQWFGLAATLTILFIWLSCKKTNDG